MDTSKLRNKVRKASTLTTNDPKRRTARLELGGQIKSLLTTRPQTLKMSGLAADSKSLDVELIRGSNLDIDIESIESVKKLVEVESIEEIAAGSKFLLSLTAGAGKRPMMDRDTLKVKLKTSDGVSRETTLSVLVEHLDRVVISPRRNLVFRKQQAQELRTGARSSISQSLFLTSAKEGLNFQVTGAEIKGVQPGVFDVDYKEIKPGERYRVTVTLKKYVDVPNLRGNLVIHTDDPENATKQVRLYAQFADPPRVNRRSGTKGNPAVKGRNNTKKPSLTPRPKVTPKKETATPKTGTKE